MNNEWRSLGPKAALIALVTLIIYVPAFKGGFVFDDSNLIVENRLVHSRDGLSRFWFTTEAPDYYPLTWSLWWVEWRLWGNNPTGYHVVNVLLHAANAILVWLVLQRLKIPGAWLAALVFAIHPVNVATVAWISEQKNTLSMLFLLIAILFYLRFDNGTKARWYILALAAFLLALLSKTAVIMLPVVLLGCVWWLHNQVRWKDVVYSLPFIVMSLLFGAITIWFQGDAFVRKAGLPLRVAEAGWASWFYLYKAILPIDLTVIYSNWEIDPNRWISYVPSLLLCVCFAVLWRNRYRLGGGGMFGLGYFLAMLFPVLGFFDQGFYQYALVADHWQYYSIVGVIALAVGCGTVIVQRTGKTGQSAGALIAAVLLMVLGAATWRRSCVYADNETLWRDNIVKNPTAWAAYNNLGVALWQSGQAQQAIRCWERAVQIKPDYPEAHNNLGSPLSQSGDFEGAITHYEKALQAKPDYVEVQHNLGIVLARVGRLPEAIGHYEQALRIRPDFAEAHYDLGIALMRLGRVQEATNHWELAVRIKPDYVEAYFVLGEALEQMGGTTEASQQYEHALSFRPDFTAASNALVRLRGTQPTR